MRIEVMNMKLTDTKTSLGKMSTKYNLFGFRAVRLPINFLDRNMSVPSEEIVDPCSIS